MRDRGSVVIVEVNVKECIATVYFNGIQYCFLSETINGTFGTGQGQEYTDKDIYIGTHLPVWIDIKKYRLLMLYQKRLH